MVATGYIRTHLTKLEPWSSVNAVATRNNSRCILRRPGVKRWRTSMLPKRAQPGTLDQKEIMKRINHNDLTHYFIAIYDKKVRQLPISYIKSCNKFIEENSIAAQIYRSTPIREWRKARKDFEENGYPWLKIKKASSRKPQA